MIDIDQVRLLLRLDKEDIDDNELQTYITHFTKATLGRISPRASEDSNITDNPVFQEAVHLLFPKFGKKVAKAV